MAKINKTLNELKEVLSSEEIEEIKLERFSTKAGIKLWVLFNQVTDPRVIGRSKYPLGEVLLLVFFAVLAGANTWVDIAAYGESKLKLLRKITEYTHGTPSHDEIRYIFGLIDPLEFQNVVMNFLRDNIQHLRKCMHLTDPGPDAYRHWAIDGKEERGTGRHYNTRIGGKVRNIQTLHVWDATDEICIYSEKIDEKTNEIPVAQRFLRSQDTLENTLITCDALHTQKVTTQIIIKKDGDYVLGLKGNQTGLLEDATAYFDEDTLKAIRDSEVDYYTETEKAHSQIEKREYFLVRPEPDSERDKEWSGISSYVCCRKTITPLDGSQATVETRYYVASIDDIRLCASAIRQHWFCECGHWHLDHSSKEDENTTMDSNAFENLSLFFKIILALLKILKVTPEYKGDSINTIRKKFAWNSEENLKHLFGIIDKDVMERTINDNKLSKKKKDHANKLLKDMTWNPINV